MYAIKKMATIIVAAVLTVSSAAKINAAEENQINFSATAGTAAIGDTVNVNVAVDTGSEKLSGFTITIGYDANEVKFVDPGEGKESSLIDMGDDNHKGMGEGWILSVNNAQSTVTISAMHMTSFVTGQTNLYNQNPMSPAFCGKQKA